jgi:hypothetical protein
MSVISEPFVQLQSKDYRSLIGTTEKYRGLAMDFRNKLVNCMLLADKQAQMIRLLKLNEMCCCHDCETRRHK